MLLHSEWESQERDRSVSELVTHIASPTLTFHPLSHSDFASLISCICLTSCYNLVQILLIISLFFLHCTLTLSYGEGKYISILLKQNIKKKKPQARKLEQTPTQTRLLLLFLCCFWCVKILLSQLRAWSKQTQQEEKAKES